MVVQLLVVFLTLLILVVGAVFGFVVYVVPGPKDRID